MLKACPTCARIGCTEHKRKPSPSGRATSKYAHQKLRARLKRKPQTCHICRQAILDPADQHADHVIPVSKGGALTIANVRPSHSWCNQRKGDRLIRDNQHTN